ncbi:hypothetical protein [Armatimonas sp.]|uniref:hypothetical protein n=1 Tax=Armatimonas sp. TaxID=1872638 RepID=UPI00374CE051
MSITVGRSSSQRREGSAKAVFTLADVRQVSGRKPSRSRHSFGSRHSFNPKRDAEDGIERIPCYEDIDPFAFFSQLGGAEEYSQTKEYSQLTADDFHQLEEGDYSQLAAYDYSQLVAYQEDGNFSFFDDDTTTWQWDDKGLPWGDKGLWSDEIFFYDEPEAWVPMTSELRAIRSLMKRSSTSKRTQPEPQAHRGRSLSWFDPCAA